MFFLSRLMNNFIQFNDKNFQINFNEWFVGFCEGVGCQNVKFLVFPDSNNPEKFVFSFRIIVPYSDKAILEYIQNSLGVGNIKPYKTEHMPSVKLLVYEVDNIKDFGKVILPIFSFFEPIGLLHNFVYRIRITFNSYNYGNCSSEDLASVARHVSGDTIPLVSESRATAALKARKGIPLHQLCGTPTKSWILGYLEQTCEFSVIRNNKGVLIHHFSVSQFIEIDFLVYLNDFFKMNSRILPSNNEFVKKVTTINHHCILHIIDYVGFSFKGSKAAQYEIWANSFLQGKK